MPRTTPGAAALIALCLAGAVLPAGSVRAQGGLAPDDAAPMTGEPEEVAPLRDPRASNAAYVAAYQRYRRGDVSGALQATTQALQKTPKDVQLRFLQGILFDATGRHDDAIAVFRGLNEDFPELPEPYNNLAVMYAAQGRLDEARAALDSAIRALPGYPLAHENLGDIYLRMALREYQRSADLPGAAASARTKATQSRALMERLVPAAAGTSAPAPATSTRPPAPAAAPAPAPSDPATTRAR